MLAFMKRRLTSILVSIGLLTALIPITTTPSSAAAQTLTYNKGTRDTVATSLSQSAIDYYKGVYSYDTLANESPYELKNNLYQLMSSTMTNSVTYSSLPSYWKYTDAEQGKAGTVLFYSDEISTYFNREHVWPKSHASFYQINGGSDLHHLRPADVAVNETRGSMTMGNLGHQGTAVFYNGKTVGWYNESTNIFEPLDNVKGDIARIFLYVYVRWQQPNLYEYIPYSSLPAMDYDDKKNDGQAVIESLNTLLDWMLKDPVDTWEMNRNDLIQQIQGNRNVFIDYPALAWKLFGQAVPDSLAIPNETDSPTSVVPSPSITDAPSTPDNRALYKQINSLKSIKNNGKYVITANYLNSTKSLSCSLKGGNMAAKTIDIPGNAITNPDASIVWTVKYNAKKKYYALYNAKCKKYLTISKNAEKGFTLQKKPAYVFKVCWNSKDYNAVCFYAPAKKNRAISLSSTNRFTCQKKSNARPLYVYQLQK